MFAAIASAQSAFLGEWVTIDDESGEIVVDKIEPIVNTEEKSFEVKPMEDDDAPINLLKGITEGK